MFQQLPNLELGDQYIPIANPKLAELYKAYFYWCGKTGTNPAKYDTWKMLQDSGYKMAGVTRK